MSKNRLTKSLSLVLVLATLIFVVGMDITGIFGNSPFVYGASTSKSSNDVTVLAKMIHGEARGEPYIGQVAVGAVILNRVKDKQFPNSVYSVCFQPGAFDAIRDGQYFSHPSESSLKAARAAINGYDPTYGALYYWNPRTATSRWIWSRKIMLRIGEHVFGI